MHLGQTFVIHIHFFARGLRLGVLGRSFGVYVAIFLIHRTSKHFFQCSERVEEANSFIREPKFVRNLLCGIQFVINKNECRYMSISNIHLAMFWYRYCCTIRIDPTEKFVWYLIIPYPVHQCDPRWKSVNFLGGQGNFQQNPKNIIALLSNQSNKYRSLGVSHSTFCDHDRDVSMQSLLLTWKTIHVDVTLPSNVVWRFRLAVP